MKGAKAASVYLALQFVWSAIRTPIQNIFWSAIHTQHSKFFPLHTPHSTLQLALQSKQKWINVLKFSALGSYILKLSWQKCNILPIYTPFSMGIEQNKKFS